MANNLTLFVANPGTSVSPGIHLPCFGPFVAPVGARALRTFLPRVDMGIVHHMIMFGGRGAGVAAAKPGSTHLCYQGSIMYAWARTGQTTPIGLDFADTKVEGDAFAVGPGTQFEWFALQIHYQQLGWRPVNDRSGVTLTFGREVPKRALEVQLMASYRLRIPPRVRMDECVACRVQSGGTVVAWRNHAHRLARDIWSEHFDSDGVPLSPLGAISAQQPQIFRVLPVSRPLGRGDSLLLHCTYDATTIDRVTYLGADERTHEMCNQYLMASAGTRLNCNADSTHHDAPFATRVDAAASMGEVVGLAADQHAGIVYALHRGPNRFDSTGIIVAPAVLAFNLSGALHASLARRTFIVPHGLSIDHTGSLWATDVRRHQVLQLDPTADGAVLLALGVRGEPGSGPRHFNAPTDVAVHAATGRIFVADGYGNARIAVFAADGTYEREWGGAGNGDGRFRVPHSIAIDVRGDVYVADRENSRVQVFDMSGRYKTQWVSRVASTPTKASYSKHVSSISYHPTLDLFAVSEGDTVQLRTPSGCALSQTDGGLLWPHDAVLLPTAAPAGRSPPNRSAMAQGGAQFSLFVAELNGKRMRRFNAMTLAASAQSADPYSG